MDKIYVVYGAVGDSPDEEIRLIAAYTKEKDALRHIKEAAKRAKEIIDIILPLESWDLSKHPNYWDKDMSMDSTGPTYWCEELELYGNILEFKLMI